MGSLLRQKKQKACFYCGHRTAQSLSVNVRQWNCESCEAQNYLDEKGEITDPPPLDYTAGKRFARSPEVPGTDDTLFCRRCIQNQHLLTASLASYFPSPEAPDYLTYEEKYPKFRESLEERYPQVCRDCAPKVEQRIRDTGYAAKTDHLRRMMDRTRRGQHGNSWDWKQLLVTLGLFLWFASLAGQVTWHAMGALTITQEPDKLQDEDPAASPGSCFQQSLQLQHVDPSCARVYHPFAGLALAISVLCIAWNPKLGEKLRRKEGRIVGLTEYYKLQILLLAIKFIAWLVLSSCSSFYLEPQTMKAAHAIMIVVSILISVVSFRKVHVDYTPKFSFQENPRSLLPQHPTVGAMSSNPDRPKIGLTSSVNASGPSTSSFPISQLAPSGPRVHASQYRPPTPPPEESETEPMDWSPIHTPFRTPSTYQSRQPLQQPTQPSPFYGSLPPNVSSQAQRLRNPKEPTYHHASSPKQTISFKGTKTQVSLRPNKSTALSSGLDTHPSASSPIPSQSSPMAQPRFFAPSDRETATGLESLFSTTFTVKEEPAEVQLAQQAQDTQPDNQPVSEVTNPALTLFELSYHRRITGILIVLATICWAAAASWAHLSRMLYPASIGAASVVACLNIFHVLQREREDWSLSDALVFGCELLMSIFVGRGVSFSTSSLRQGTLIIGRWLLYLMLAQEVWLVWKEVSRKRDAHLALVLRDAWEQQQQQQQKAGEGGQVVKIGRGDGMW